MRASVSWQGDQRYDALSESGHHIAVDADKAHTTGASPMEMVLLALCACTSVDVVTILQKKRQSFTALTVSAVAEQAPLPPRVFTHIQLTYRVVGEVDAKAMADAVDLSKHKYCSVSAMLEKSAVIDFVIEHVPSEMAGRSGAAGV